MSLFYIGIFLISLATLVNEIALTRIFSVTLWYHFAFMVVSIALFGFGASGAFLTIFRGFLKKDKKKVTTFLALSFSITSVASILVVSRISLDPFQITSNYVNILNLLIYYLVLAIPFFMSGLCICFLINSFPMKAGKIYFFNLAGSGVGCFAAIFMIPLFTTAGVVVAAAMLILLAAFLFNFNSSKKVNLLIIGILALYFLLMNNLNAVFNFKIANSKALSRELYELKNKPLFTKYNAFSRLDVLEAKNEFYAPGLSIKYPFISFPKQTFIFIDADAVATITQVEKKEGGTQFFKYIPSSMAYRLKKHPTVCIIGAGGGFDVLTALSTSEPKHITAIEINPDISKIVRHNFNQYSGSIYDLPNVSLQDAEGRSFIRNSQEHFDIIQLTLVDTWAAASTGAYTLSENYLYTEEAFRDYINHLAPDGILTITRWLLIPPKENLRIAAMAFSALEKTGISNPRNNIVFVQSGNVATLLLKKTAFDRSEIEGIEKLCEESGFGILYAPHIAGSNIFYALLNCKDKDLFYALYPFNIEPSTDDKPFFFHYYSWKNIEISKLFQLSSIDRNNISYSILLFLLIQAVILSGIFILGPLVFLKRSSSVKISSGGNFLLYFSCLGIGFMFVEITLIQKFILFLGHPIYSLSVVLFSLLVSAGLGSLYTERIKQNHIQKLKLILGILVAFLFIYMIFLAKLSQIFLGWHLVARCIISILALVPLGFFMGMPFPLGIRLLAEIDSKLIPWVWGVNSCFSVTSSVLSVIIAMSLGFSAVLKCASIAYLLAIIAIQRHFLLSTKVSSGIT
jgi:hypothetical protein